MPLDAVGADVEKQFRQTGETTWRSSGFTFLSSMKVETKLTSSPSNFAELLLHTFQGCTIASDLFFGFYSGMKRNC